MHECQQAEQRYRGRYQMFPEFVVEPYPQFMVDEICQENGQECISHTEGYRRPYAAQIA
ncbi:hypothetical protein SDC9_195263 [bioreactor metagenome]|uniref:Uncharacterized protein n=1 Tax=bioreactor metagenome TaxID=1076179 RepID=A0A645IB42_9ZZZZ